MSRSGLCLDASNLREFARGCAVLGAGGGGDPDLGVVMAMHAIAEHGPVPVVPLDALDDGLCVMPCGMIGSPTVASERIWSGAEGAVLCAHMELLHKTPVAALMSFQIGGANGVLPVTWAARCGLPLVDADGMGRAFGELHQQAMHVAGVNASPLVLADGRGNTLVLRAADDIWAARLARDAATSLGGVCAGALYAMTVAIARGAVVEDTVSLAIALGSAMLGRASSEVLRVAEQLLGATVLIEGRVVDLERESDGDVVRGSATVQSRGPDGLRQLRLELQNEFLLALEDGAVRAAVPDLICVLGRRDGNPVATEELRYGQEVAIFAAPACALWHSPDGLRVVGPRAFGYDVDHVPIAGAPRADRA